MSDLKPITLYSHAGGPNPWKVAIFLNELDLPYETKMMDFGDLKKDPFEKINPNGRVPAIEDPNHHIKVWESGAIIEYLLETYHKHGSAKELLRHGGQEKWDAKAWLHFQTSGQGPYYGQRAWFTLYHAEKNLTSVLDRYGNEIKRVISVIDAHLKKTGQKYLVDDKISYADLAFIPWFWLVIDPPHIMGANFASEWEKEFPVAWAWNKRVQERPSVVKAHEARVKAVAAAKK